MGCKKSKPSRAIKIIDDTVEFKIANGIHRVLSSSSAEFHSGTSEIRNYKAVLRDEYGGSYTYTKKIITPKNYNKK
jgi:hypothetical protein